MEQFSEILKQVHNCTETCNHLQDEEEILPVLKLRSKTAENKENKEMQETYQEEIVKYSFNNSPRVKKNLLKIRKTVPSKNQSAKITKGDYYDEIAMYNEDYNLFNQIKRDNTSIKPKPININPVYIQQAIRKRKPRESTIQGDNIWIYAHDHSISNKRTKGYFEKAQKHLEKFRKSFCGAHNKVYLLYNHNSRNTAEKATYETMNQIYKYKLCFGRSSRNALASISNWIFDNGLENKKITLFIITSAEIDQTAVLTCNSMNNGINFKNVNVFTISEEKIDNSVAFCFMRPNCKINIYEETAEGIDRISFDNRGYDFSKMNIGNFLRRYDNLLNYVIGMYTIDYKKKHFNSGEKREARQEIEEFVKNLLMKKMEMVEQCQHQKENSQDLLNKNCEAQEKLIARKMDSIVEFIFNCSKDSLSFPELKKQIKSKQNVEKAECSTVTA